MKKILKLLIVSSILCYTPVISYAEDTIEITSEPLEETESFDTDVVVYVDGEKIAQSFPEILETKYITKSGTILEKSSEVLVVEQKEKSTKVLYGENFYIIPNHFIGDEEDIFTHYCEELPLSEDLQEYIYKKCEEAGIKYCLFLGLCQQETQFGTYGAINNIQFHNLSKHGDYGMCQTNKKYVWPDIKEEFGWNDITVLFDPYRSVDAGIYELSKCVAKYGNTEAAYDAYNRGLEHHGSTVNSRRVVKFWNNWKEILGDI